MKLSPEEQKIQEILKSDRIVSGGFLGTDTRNYLQIIEDDASELARLGWTKELLADKMSYVTEIAVKGLGTWVKVAEDLEAKVDEAKGELICPWPDGTQLFHKRVTILRRISTDETVMWTDLSIHFIREHGFFEGRGAAFRLEPAELVKFLEKI